MVDERHSFVVFNELQQLLLFSSSDVAFRLGVYYVPAQINEGRAPASRAAFPSQLEVVPQDTEPPAFVIVVRRRFFFCHLIALFSWARKCRPVVEH